MLIISGPVTLRANELKCGGEDYVINGDQEQQLSAVGTDRARLLGKFSCTNGIHV